MTFRRLFLGHQTEGLDESVPNVDKSVYILSNARLAQERSYSQSAVTTIEEGGENDIYRALMKKKLTRAPLRAMTHSFSSLLVLMMWSGFVTEGCHMGDESSVLGALKVMWLVHCKCL